MKKSRLEAFSDGVLAIIITIMVLELEAPEEVSWQALTSVAPTFVSYVLSFIYVGIFWNNHHHLLQITEKVNGRVLWANLHFLFWLSLVPFASAWLGEHHLSPAPVALYGFILLMGGVAFQILQTMILKNHDEDFALRQALGRRNKERLSLLMYLIGLATSYLSPLTAMICYVIVALMWLVPDKRIENNFNPGEKT